MEAPCDVMAVLRLAPAPLVSSLLRFHLGDESIKDLAEEIGMCRFKLGRQLDGLKHETRMRMTA